MSLSEHTPLRKIRLARGLTIQEVSKKVGTNSGNLSRIECGKQLASRALVTALVDFYGPEIDQRHICCPDFYKNWNPKGYVAPVTEPTADSST